MRVRRQVLTAALFIVSTFTATIAAASSPVPKDAKYAGEVGPGFLMHFDVTDHGSEVSKLVVSFEATCDPGAGDVAPDFDFKTLEIHDGSFSGATSRSFGPTVSDFLRIEGKFKDNGFSGDVTDTQRITSLPSCTETEPFSAKPVA